MERIAKIGIWFDPGPADRKWGYGLNVFELYLEEILGHAGIPFERLTNSEELKAYRPDLLLIAQNDEKDSSLLELKEYVRQGGTLISYAGLNRLAGELGCRAARYREAVYATLPGIETGTESGRLRALGAMPWLPLKSGADAPTEAGTLHTRGTDGVRLGAAFAEFAWGSGKLIRWNVNIPDTIVHLQQGGAPVVEDGIAAPDGSGNLDEGILKGDDECELDWEQDRSSTETGMGYYSVPYADLWREALAAQLFREADAKGLLLPFLDYWPEGIEQVAMISHDSDLNLDESAYATLDVLKECGIHSTWCMIEPGYSKSVYERVRAEGHELAFHYNALEMDKGYWDAAEFERQLSYIRSAVEVPVVSNKNHYTRFEGWGELFRWCEKNGIESDQTRGPSKKGNIGFLFGTCHPYYPIAWADERNRMYRVLEIGFLTQDLDHATLADSSVIRPFLEQVSRVRGVAHFLFHQIHILQQPKVKEAVRKVVREAKERGFVFWTGEQITKWEQARRKAQMKVDADGRVSLEQLQPEMAVMVYAGGRAAGGQRSASAEDGHVDPAVRFGLPCRAWRGTWNTAMSQTAESAAGKE